MAQPRRSQREVSPERKELDNLEKRTSQMLERRNELNDQARTLRGERDMLNNRRNEIFDEVEPVREKRDAFNEELQEHKRLRNEYQAQAKTLIGRRRGTERAHQEFHAAPLKARELEQEVQDLEYRQQTQVLKPKAEEKLVKEIRLKRAGLAKLRPEIAKATRVKVDLTDADRAIQELFALADAEHKQVMALYKASQAEHAKFVELIREAARVGGEANAKHAEFIDLKKKADAEHAKVMELRSKIMEIKGAEREERDEGRRILRERRKEVEAQVADPSKLEAHVDEELERLRKGGKIQIGS